MPGFRGICWGQPPSQDASDHQDDITCLIGICQCYWEGGPYPRYMGFSSFLKWNSCRICNEHQALECVVLHTLTCLTDAHTHTRFLMVKYIRKNWDCHLVWRIINLITCSYTLGEPKHHKSSDQNRGDLLYIGDEILLPSNMDIIINHEIRIPY